MSTTYFKTSNIEKLTNKSRNKNKNKKVSDKEAEDEKDEKIIEGFDPTSMLGGKDSVDGKNPSSNIFSSSDNDNDNDNDNSKKKDDITNPTSFIGTQKSNTQKSAEEQMDPNSILIFCIHALLSVLFAYVWGWLSTNFLYLATESEDKLDYILPIDEYHKPYTNNATKNNCWYNYGFPYNLGNRNIGKENAVSDRIALEKRQKDITYYLLLSKENANDENKQGFYYALVQYIFEAVYGGLGINGGRYAMRMILSIFSISDSIKEDKSDTWDRMKDKTFLKVSAFLSWPIIMQFIFPVIGIWSGVTSFIFGILQNHIIWGLIFSFTIGIFIAMGCGFYMVLNALYVFFIYPWSNDNSDVNSAGKWRKIFDDLKVYMLFIFYFQICIYGFKDLGGVGGAGIMFIVVVSIILQYMQHSS
jgi:hypothetical protein